MASGWGITGNKGRCYDFWMDFSECMSRCREPKDCSLLREDYLECLHHSKEGLNEQIEAGEEGSYCLIQTERMWLEANKGLQNKVRRLICGVIEEIT
ncbi:hypothetical protein Hanom_Chr11g01047361 [Helianthus anomalus]